MELHSNAYPVSFTFTTHRPLTTNILDQSLKVYKKLNSLNDETQDLQ